jgi:hypothetical protein
VFSGMGVGLASPTNIDFMRQLFFLKQVTSPFFVALDPKTQISYGQDDFLLFCRFLKEPSYSQELFRYFNIEFELKEAM